MITIERKKIQISIVSINNKIQKQKPSNFHKSCIQSLSFIILRLHLFETVILLIKFEPVSFSFAISVRYLWERYSNI